MGRRLRGLGRLYRHLLCKGVRREQPSSGAAEGTFALPFHLRLLGLPGPARVPLHSPHPLPATPAHAQLHLQRDLRHPVIAVFLFAFGVLEARGWGGG